MILMSISTVQDIKHNVDMDMYIQMKPNRDKSKPQN